MGKNLVFIALFKDAFSKIEVLVYSVAVFGN